METGKKKDTEMEDVVAEEYECTTRNRCAIMREIVDFVREAKSKGMPKSSWLDVSRSERTLLGVGGYGEVHRASVRTHPVAVKLTCCTDLDLAEKMSPETLGLYTGTSFVRKGKSPNFAILYVVIYKIKKEFLEKFHRHLRRAYVIELGHGTLGSWLRFPGSDDRIVEDDQKSPTAVYSRKAVSTEEQAGAAAQVLSALYDLGCNGAFHGHISPGNVLRVAVCGPGTAQPKVSTVYLCYLFNQNAHRKGNDREGKGNDSDREGKGSDREGKGSDREGKERKSVRVYGSDLFLVTDMSTYRTPSCPRALFDGLRTDVCSLLAIMTGQWMSKDAVGNNASQKKIQKAFAVEKLDKVINISELLAYIAQAITNLALLSKPKSVQNVPCLGVFNLGEIPNADQ